MIEVRPSEPSDADRLLQIWRSAVDSSHDFLTRSDRDEIHPQVADYVATAPLLVAVRDGEPVAFMGVTGQHIDSLFVDPAAHGSGVGRLLTETVGTPATVDVNEQNQRAVSFYRYLGFEVTGRSQMDDQGRPYPLLHMRRD